MHSKKQNRQKSGNLIARRNPFKKGMRLLFLGSAALAHCAAWAQEAATSAATVPTIKASDATTAGLLQTTIGLLLVLGLLLILMLILKRTGIVKQQRRGGFYKVLATSALGPREKIVLIEVGNTWLVLGMTSNSINTLHSMPAGSMELEQGQNPAASFAKMLERIKTGAAKQ